MDYLPAVMPLLKPALYRRPEGQMAVQVNVNDLFSFDLLFQQKTWWFSTSTRPPVSRYIAPKPLHRSPGRVALHVAQIAFWNGCEVLDDELEAADDLRYLGNGNFTAWDRLRADAVARSAYEFTWRGALGQADLRLASDEIYLSKQLIASFDEELESVDLDARSWSERELGLPF